MSEADFKKLFEPFVTATIAWLKLAEQEIKLAEKRIRKIQRP